MHSPHDQTVLTQDAAVRDEPGARVPTRENADRLGLAVIGDDLVAAFAAWMAVRNGLTCCWLRTRAEADLWQGQPRLVTPVIPLLQRQRRLGLLPRVIRPAPFKFAELRAQASNLVQSQIAVHRGDRDETARVLAMLVRRSIGILADATPLFDALLQPTRLRIIAGGAELSDGLSEAAAEWGAALEAQSLTPGMADSPFDAWEVSGVQVASDASALFLALTGSFRARGGQTITCAPTRLNRSDDHWQVSGAGKTLRATQLFMTSEQVFRQQFQSASARLPLGNYFVLQQHFARLGAASEHFLAADGSFALLSATRGQRLSLSPLPLLAPGEAVVRLRDIYEGAVEHLVGEPRDVRSNLVLRLAHDLVPVVDEIAENPGLWVALGFGDQDVALAPAAVQLVLARMMGFRFEPFEKALGAARLEKFQLLSVARSGLAVARDKIGQLVQRGRSVSRSRKAKGEPKDPAP